MPEARPALLPRNPVKMLQSCSSRALRPLELNCLLGRPRTQQAGVSWLWSVVPEGLRTSLAITEDRGPDHHPPIHPCRPSAPASLAMACRQPGWRYDRQGAVGSAPRLPAPHVATRSFARRKAGQRRLRPQVSVMVGPGGRHCGGVGQTGFSAEGRGLSASHRGPAQSRPFTGALPLGRR